MENFEKPESNETSEEVVEERKKIRGEIIDILAKMGDLTGEFLRWPYLRTHEHLTQDVIFHANKALNNEELQNLVSKDNREKFLELWSSLEGLVQKHESLADKLEKVEPVEVPLDRLQEREDLRNGIIHAINHMGTLAGKSLRWPGVYGREHQASETIAMAKQVLNDRNLLDLVSKENREKFLDFWESLEGLVQKHEELNAE